MNQSYELPCGNQIYGEDILIIIHLSKIPVFFLKRIHKQNYDILVLLKVFIGIKVMVNNTI
jgi:hypothetical protein